MDNSTMRLLLEILGVIVIGGMLVSCQSSPPTEQAFCSAARPIYIKKSDKLTLETTREIVGHNELGQRLCGWQSPK